MADTSDIQSWQSKFFLALESSEQEPLAECMQSIAEYSAHLDQASDERGRTLLMEAAHAGSAEAVDILIQQGANANLPDENGYTPLALARGYDCAQLLIKAGARVQVRANNGASPILIAAQRGELQLVRLLLANGADPDSPNRWGATPLMRAAENGSLEVVSALLDAGADPARRDRWGRCALDELRMESFWAAA